MALSARRLRGVASLTVAVVAASSIAFTAIQADGRPASTEETNDGGAWLLDRRASAVGHVNRATREVTGAVRAADAGSDFWVDQSADTVLVHNTSNQSISVVDGRTYAATATAPVGFPADVAAVDGGVTIATIEPLQVWQMPVSEFTALDTDLADVDATIASTAPGQAVVTPTDVVVAADADGVGHWLFPDGRQEEVDLPLEAELVGVTALGDDLVAVDAGGRLAVSAPGGTASLVESDPAALEGVTWQQPGPAAPMVVGTRADGATVVVDRASGEVETAVALDGQDPVAPIVHGGCVFALVQQPATFARQCGEDVAETPISGHGGGPLTMRLVNGWVWINAVDTGQAWVVDEQGDLEEVDDVGDALEQDEEETEEDPEEGESTRQRQDNEADEVGTADKLDDDGRNEPPTANPDEVVGRQGDPIVVNVLANDTDPDGDVLLVTSAGTRDDTALVEVTADQRYVQVTPPVDFTGVVTFEYAISDGRGGTDGTTSTLEVVPDDEADNQPPTPETDFVAAAPGAAASVNVLDNDTDPEGDSLVLLEIEGEGATVVSAPDGEVTVTPDEAAAGELELGYTVADSFGATASGRVRVDVRTVEEANRPPDARNDSGTTTVGKPIVFNLLDNDADPDGDRITVSGPPTSVSTPSGGDEVYTSLSPDGVFLIEAPVAGDYVFRYQVSDGAFSDEAQIRVLVREEEENRPPVAVRDDAVIPAGATRVVQALRNDGDPDGDVIAITGWTGSPGLVVERIEGIGFRVTALPTASPREVFTYEVSDGVNDPVLATVVVTVSEATGEDQRPVAKPDVVEVQPGQSVAVPVLRNDFDPEGGSLEVVTITERDDATLAVGGAGQSVIVTLPGSARLGFTFGYEITDDAGNRASTTVEVQVVQPGDRNRPPVAVPDITTTLERTPVVVDVLGNDSDPDGDALQVESIASQPVGGSARVLEDGTLEYTPLGDFTGTDRFDYALVDARGARVTGQVLVGVMLPDENRPPIAVPDTVEVVAGTQRGLLDVLVNDLDPDGDRLVVTDTSDVRLGEVAIAPGGTGVLYTPPDVPEDGQDRDLAFRYSIDDGAGHTVDGTVHVTVLAEAEPVPPVANDDQAGPTTAGEAVVVEVLANDLDPDGDPADLDVSSDDPAVRVRPDGRVSITPGDTTRSYVYEVTDADDLTASAAVTVIVVDNRAPVVESRQVETAFETPVEVDVTGQASDPDGDRLLFVCCDQVRGGTPEITSADATTLEVRFVPNPGFDGEAGFAFTVDDDNGHQVAGSVLVTVEPEANRPPEVADREVTAEVGRTTTLDLAGLVTDPDTEDEHTFELSEQGGPMSLSRSGDRVVIDPEITATGQTGTFVVTATDEAGNTGAGRVTVPLTASTLPPPVATGDRARTTQGVEVSVPVLANDIGDGLRVVSASSPDGTADVRGDQVVFRPDNDFFGTAVVTYTIGDEQRTEARQDTAQARVDVIGFPGKPATPRVVADSREATINWSAPAANGSPIDGYELEHDQGGSQALGTSTTHQWTALDNGTSYRFRIRATNEAGPSPWSDWSPAVIPNEVPGRPAAPQVDFADEALDVDWTAPANDGTAILRYELEIGGGTTGSREIPPGGSRTAYTWEGLSNGTNHQFRVRAINAAGESAWSSWSATEHPLTTPDAPEVGDVSNGPNYLQISWNRPYDGGDTIQRYQVQRRDAGGGSTSEASVSGASTTSYRWGDLPNGKEFQFRVRAINRAEATSDGWSAWSAPAKACDVPDRPGAPGASRGDRQVDVSWSAPGANGCGITGYDVQHDQASTVRTAGASATSLNWSGLTNGTTYRFRVRAGNEQGSGGWSDWSSAATPAGAPFAPPGFSGAPVTGENGHVRLTWNAADANGAGIDRYEVRVNAGPWQGVGGAGTRAHTVTGLNPGTTYTFRVRVVNAVGPGEVSSTSVAARGYPSRIGSLSVNESTRGQLTWNWGAPSGNGGGVDEYRVQRDGAANVTTSSRTYTWRNLGDNVTRRVQVRACNEYGCNPDWSPWQAGTTQAPPPPPRTITITRGADSGWDADCTSNLCHYARVSMSGWAANRTYNYYCQFRNENTGALTYTGGPWSSMHDGSSMRTNGSGSFGPKDAHCFMQGDPWDREVRIGITASGSSTVIQWSAWSDWPQG
ncbi:Ig-like domain-containing protein [Salsipaludibacter albus]|uniref:Ig-like domain-containing protein n=1 Tax=Salsipaludibacter albus TaxID=2849650 RepID=UPI001EE4B63A|nr:Ig-like domain-containing protein [Salsipaludibacter albus]MBY5161288.1 tandem-95 repeat protein [Salsipaludibacter albus]